ncbi:MAG: monovalent cation/H+ antiporter subunit D family protein [Gammaproteobacteria bacterium]|nr:monovalent cation/H+ antiporter subunit D family protein [Gammaproteobacteria bacterium]
MLDHLPVLVVLLPLMSAPLCVLVDRPFAGWLIALVASLLSFASAIGLLLQVGGGDAISYQLGGWAPPWGIEYRIDLLSAFVLLIVTGIASLVMLFARHSVTAEIPEGRIARFYAALLLAFAGLAGIVATGDAFNVFVFLEISSLASYAVISMGRDRRALNAAFEYLIMGTIGATFILIGIGFLYMMTGTLNMLDLAARLPEVADTRTVRAGFAFLTVGIGLKLAMFPLHLWLPNAYAYAPSAVTAFLAATATKVAVYVLLRFTLEIFGAEFSLGAMPLDLILMALGLIGMLSASLVAVFQHNVKRLLAYSSVAQIGYMLLGIGLASTTGATAAILHIFNHALMKGALFLAVGAVAYRIGAVTLRDFAGLGQRMPWTTAAIVLGGLSLIGVPPTVGFISKWYLVLGTLEQGLWPVAALVLIGSLLAVLYIWKLVEAAYFEPAPAGADTAHEAPWSMLLPIWLLVGANLYFGIDTDIPVGVATQAADALIGSGR